MNRGRTFFAAFVLLFCGQTQADLVISDNDGNIDDIFATWVLYQSPNDTLIASVVTDADCMGYQTMAITMPRVFSFANMTGLPCGMSKSRGKNPFPWVYRSFSTTMGEVACLNQTQTQYKPQDGDLLYKQTLTIALAAGVKVSIVATGPLSALANILKESPQLSEAISQIIFMGGSVGSCPGNIDPNVVYNFVAGTQAEWNVFWDPEAVDFIFRSTDIPIILIPLNLTNQSEITDKLMLAMKAQSQRGYALSTLAFQAYSLVFNLPKFAFKTLTGNSTTSYYLWDVTASVYKTHPEFFAQPVPMKLSVHTSGKEQGALYDDANGRDVLVVLDFAGVAGRTDFYNYFLKTLRR